MKRLDPTSQLVLDTHELGRRPGLSRSVHRVVSAPSDLGTAVMAIPEGDDLTLDLLLEAVMEGVLISGTVQGVARGECSRCLDEVILSLRVPVQELFAYPERIQVARELGDSEIDDEESVLEDDLANLDPVVRDAVVIALPFTPLCRPDCPGLCSECGVPLASDPTHTHDLTDPRWSVLTTMFDTSNMSDETKES